MYVTLTFRMTQILIWHGCFGKYLHQVAGWEPTSKYHEVWRTGQYSTPYAGRVRHLWVSEDRARVGSRQKRPLAARFRRDPE